ncbi:hypothetical protein BT69DRAFT_775258 [Atractiella rhizophila]|nr:hypothetical protein BT69DRAFT_775258 [Atractiella rhizophila]
MLERGVGSRRLRSLLHLAEQGNFCWKQLGRSSNTFINRSDSGYGSELSARSSQSLFASFSTPSPSHDLHHVDLSPQ